MTVDIFTRHDFEQALPVHSRTGERLWEALGLVDGEHAYRVTPFPMHQTLSAYGIEVRSSVHANDRSADTGEDSIRAWIVTRDGKPFGSKVARYVTRVPGWQNRLTDTLRRLTQIMRQIAPCDCCGMPCPIFKAGKTCKNPGRLFAKCTNRECPRPRFAWFNEE